MSETIKVKKKLSSKATMPIRGTKLSAGWYLHASEETTVPARGKALMKTDIAIAIPQNHYGRIAPRSGMSWKKHTDIGAGFIEVDYRGEVKVVIFNHSDYDLLIAVNDRVAQLIIEKINTSPLVEVNDLDDTFRGCSGFRSTG